MNAYQDLPDITQVKPRTAADDPLFADLAVVLDKHGARDRFGITLLHKHFNIADGEVLLEETDELNRTQTIRPVAEPPDRFTETAWRLDGSGKPATICICPRNVRTDEHLGPHIEKK